MDPTMESDPNAFSSAAEIETKKEMKEEARSQVHTTAMPSTGTPLRIVGRDLQSRHAPFYPPSHTSLLGFRFRFDDGLTCSWQNPGRQHARELPHLAEQNTRPGHHC